MLIYIKITMKLELLNDTRFVLEPNRARQLSLEH